MKSLVPRASDDICNQLSKAEPLGCQGSRFSPAAVSVPGTEADCPGPWLRAWVEFQVDARINQAFRDLAEGELLGSSRLFDGVDRLARLPPSTTGLVSAEQASQVAAEARGICQKLEEEVRLVARAQTHILSTLDGISGRVDAVTAPDRTSQSDRIQDSSSLEKAAASRLETRISELRDEAAQHQHQCSDKLASALDVLATTQREVGTLAQAVDRLAERVYGRAGSDSAEKSVDRFLIDETEARFEARCERLDRDLAAATKARSTLEGRFEELRTELASAVVTREDFRNGLEDLATDFAEAIATLKGESQRVPGRSSEDQRELEQRIELWQAALQKEIAAQQKRLVTELRGEIKSGLRSETSNLAALDEQLWSTDQRLGQRIDELAHRISLALEQLGLEHPPTGIGAGMHPDAVDQPPPEDPSQKPGAPRRIHLRASHGRRTHPVEEEIFATVGDDAEHRRLQVSPEAPSLSRGGVQVEEAYTSPRPDDRATPNRGAPSNFASRQLSRTGTWSTVSDAMATAADALSGGDDEERRQLERLARLERVQVRAVSPVATSLNMGDAPSGAKEQQQQDSDPLVEARSDAIRLRIPRYNSSVPSSENRTKSNSPRQAIVANGSSALTAAAARVARRRGPFSGGAPSS